ncbi:MAG: YjjI family glycine radical enzyme [Clostridiales Family XIII bacterium]|jgi:YjjI family glycine radical enzyme|nr:YjjI family glycine radical enzyme [Clostridiales Family XIII bacterium]
MMNIRPISAERVEETRRRILDTVCSRQLTHEQKVTGLERLAESLIEVLELPADYPALKEQGIICDLDESNCPPRPRYIVPDYDLLFEKGCDFLRLDPPTDLDEALNVLAVFIRHVPSVTNFPVFIGFLDRLLEPFVLRETRETARKKLRLFMRYVDRTVTDSFCHADLGPHDSLTGRLLLECEADEPKSVPNISFLYDPDLTPDDYARLAALSALGSAKPSFANHKMFLRDLGADYALASCYNGLLVGGGAFTLSRLRLGHLAARAADRADFWEKLAHASETMLRYMDARIAFMTEQSGFFESNFLAREGFIRRDRFTAMFGLVGLAECVNALMQKEGKTLRFGRSEEADALGLDIMDRIEALVRAHQNPYCVATDGRFLLHGQVGIDSDVGESPATRIPIGEEPAELSDHMNNCGLFHGYFPSGTGEVFALEPTARANPDYVLDMVRGGFAKGGRYFSIHAGDSDVIRVTGYLVKRSEMDKLAQGQSVLQNTTALGLGAARNARILERKRR